MTEAVRYEVADGIAWVTIDRPATRWARRFAQARGRGEYLRSRLADVPAGLA